MKLKVDENLPLEAEDVLRQSGHDVSSVFAEQLGGGPDPRLADACRREGRILMTLDTDFADIRTYPPETCAGFIVLRLRPQDKPSVLAVVRRLLPLLAAESPERRLWIVEEDRVRVRE